jgi:hypothetical protein
MGMWLWASNRETALGTTLTKEAEEANLRCWFARARERVMPHLCWGYSHRGPVGPSGTFGLGQVVTSNMFAGLSTVA